MPMLDWLLILGRLHLEAILAEYVEHYDGRSGGVTFEKLAQTTPLQSEALRLLGLSASV